MRKLFTCLFFSFASLFAAPEALYLTLPKDPAHSMAVHFIESIKNKKENVLFYRKQGESSWQTISILTKEFKQAPFRINTCLLTDLEPDTEYSFHLAQDAKIYLFRTAPLKLTRPLKIAIGGDLSLSDKLYHKMNLVVAKAKPDFILLGGDLAYVYTQGRSSSEKKVIDKWISFFKELSKAFLSEGGRLIPLATVIGNHDLSPLEKENHDMNALFFAFFPPIDNLSYRTLDLAGVISFVLLDTQHVLKIKGAQTDWLKKSLEERVQMPWRLAIYHVAAYPSIYDMEQKIPSLIRAHWVPLFEKNKVSLAFEHHNHAFKKTYPLLDGKIDPSGITYLGDGSWGVPPRKTRKKPWYIDKKAPINTFSLLTVDENSLKVEVFDNESNLVDTWKSSKD